MVFDNEYLSKIKLFLTTAPFPACLLLVHPDICRLRRTEETVRERYDWPALSVGQVLGEGLLSVAPRHRPRTAPRILAQAISEHQPGPVLCIDIDLLFEPALQLDPLRLITDASRLTALVITWPGTFQDGVLAYAVPEHSHYRAWRQPSLCDGCIVSM
jgi:hypothetical protein